jgi:hypothetical protein
MWEAGSDGRLRRQFTCVRESVAENVLVVYTDPAENA